MKKYHEDQLRKHARHDLEKEQRWLDASSERIGAVEATLVRIHARLVVCGKFSIANMNEAETLS